MLIGNPYKFAIFIDVIEEWNIDEAFCNGVLLFFVDGNIFPKEIVTTVLKCEVESLKKHLINLSIDERLYNMPKDKAFAEIYNLTFPRNTDVDNDYRFDITPMSFSDSDCFVFAVSNGERVRIMSAKLDYIMKDSRHELNNANVSEAFVGVDEVNDIISKL